MAQHPPPHHPEGRELQTLCMYVLVFQRKPGLLLMKRFSSLKHKQHFDAHNFNQKKEK